MFLVFAILGLAVMPNSDIDVQKTTTIKIQQNFLEVEHYCNFMSDITGPVDFSTDGIAFQAMEKSPVEATKNLDKITILEAKAEKDINASYMPYVNSFGFLYLMPSMQQFFKRGDELFVRYRIEVPGGVPDVPLAIGLISPLSQRKIRIRHTVIVESGDNGFEVSEIYPKGKLPDDYPKLFVQTIIRGSKKIILGDTVYESVSNAWPGGGIRKSKEIKYFGVLLSKPLRHNHEAIVNIKVNGFGQYSLNQRVSFKAGIDKLLYRFPLSSEIRSYEGAKPRVMADGNNLSVRYKKTDEFNATLYQKDEYIAYTISDIDHHLYPSLKIERGGIAKELIVRIDGLADKLIEISLDIDCQDITKFQQIDALFYRFKPPLSDNSMNRIASPDKWHIEMPAINKPFIEQVSRNSVEVNLESGDHVIEPLIFDIKSEARNSALVFKCVFYILTAFIILCEIFDKQNYGMALGFFSFFLSIMPALDSPIRFFQMFYYTKASLATGVFLGLYIINFLRRFV